MIEILFINKLPLDYASMYSMGLAYSELNEGSLYPNYTSPVKVDQTAPVGDAVPPDQSAVYKWLINDGSAPTQGAASHMWAYHSYVSMDNDLNAGLIGPTIVYPRGQMNATMASHREFTLLYMNFDESVSFLSATNAQAAGILNKNATTHTLFPNTPTPDQPTYSNYSIWHPQLTNLISSSTLTTTQAPTFMSLNSRSLANGVPFEMCQDDAVIWYVYSVGSSSHVFHMRGNEFTSLRQNKASLSLDNGVMQALPMTARGVGEWRLICHVSDHLQSGMEDPYVVYPAGRCPLGNLARMG
jgi:FtsP/CotA-like multicopper oxidase with cupredoxin domain